MKHGERFYNSVHKKHVMIYKHSVICDEIFSYFPTCEELAKSIIFTGEDATRTNIQKKTIKAVWI